jgi:hypothetical protein
MMLAGEATDDIFDDEKITGLTAPWSIHAIIQVKRKAVCHLHALIAKPPLTILL